MEDVGAELTGVVVELLEVISALGVHDPERAMEALRLVDRISELHNRAIRLALGPLLDVKCLLEEMHA